MPLWVKLTAGHFKRILQQSLVALSITTAYLRNEDILTAVEKIFLILISRTKCFRGFVSSVKLINPDVTTVLLDLKEQIDNAVFQEWCDAIIACQHDRV